MLQHEKPLEINEINVDSTLKAAIEECLEFLDSAQWAGRAPKTAHDLDELEHDLHQTLARALGDELRCRIDRLRRVSMPLSHHDPFEAPDHETNQDLLPEICQQLSETVEVLREIETLLNRMIDRDLYPELNLTPELDYVARLRETFDGAHQTLRCCQRYYDHLTFNAFHPRRRPCPPVPIT